MAHAEKVSRIMNKLSECNKWLLDNVSLFSGRESKHQFMELYRAMSAN